MTGARRIWRNGALGAWLILLIAVAFAVASNRQYAHRVSDQSASIRELRSESEASCQNYLALRDAVNRFHSSLSGLLATAEKARRASYARTHDRSDLVAARSYARLRANLLTVHKTCAQRR